MDILKALKREQRNLEHRAAAIGKAIQALNGSYGRDKSGGRKLSAVARPKISRAQKKRWKIQKAGK